MIRFVNHKGNFKLFFIAIKDNLTGSTQTAENGQRAVENRPDNCGFEKSGFLTSFSSIGEMSRRMYL